MWVWCLLFGHEDMLVRSPRRLRLHCWQCGRETPGWTLNARPSLRPRSLEGHARSPEVTELGVAQAA